MPLSHIRAVKFIEEEKSKPVERRVLNSSMPAVLGKNRKSKKVPEKVSEIL